MSSSFRILFDQHYDPLCRAAYRILRDRDIAREIVQDVFVDVWKKGQWENLDSPRAYLYVAVYHRCINEIRTGRRFSSEDQMPDRSTTSDEFQTSQLEKIIIEGINSLPEQCRRIFILSREEELAYRQIADHLGLSVKTIERQMGIALQKLRDYLQKHWS